MPVTLATALDVPDTGIFSSVIRYEFRLSICIVVGHSNKL